ncbi:MAG TPA: MTH1187 family thiamine-binding protein [Thermodesulfobacteriota bacterium]|nr:MTH1187 family thiamine-binding protein [Deltaproteobacteria bacterium]HNR12840.1 MTH1187 family thiamine-binding protein [Thermodesulfobacteriota bacterium]HNU72301.1 MTH1187 family thiamine-binding protein [Thermodesulfobacteriota bacterium]HOC38334.1 MTH1187 family thiamine-binding protein [Thermodesulfobacteriota bacterium]HQO79074.1 MTH1187 family thiamine-binding protein [Thermodesulfobacteriota bacterium]
MIMVELSMFPVDKGESLSSYVARILEIIDRSGLSYRLNPMGTVIEGEWDEVMKTIRQCHRALEQDCKRISTTIKIDYRSGAEHRIDAKTASVENKSGRAFRK